MRQRASFLNNTSIQTLHIRNSPVLQIRMPRIGKITRAPAMALLDYGFDFGSKCVCAKSQPSLRLLVVGPLSYAQNWELQQDASRQRVTEGICSAEGIYSAWPYYSRPTLFRIGYTKVSGARTYAIVQEEFSSTRSIQDRFSARVLDSVRINQW